MWSDVQQEETAEEVNRCKAVISKYRGLYDLPKESQDELDKAYKDLEDIQRRCFHTWKKMEMFVTIKNICTICDKETS